MSENNKIELTGILSEGYGIIPKKLMKMNIHKNMKLILAYMLSFTGAGKNSCFPSYSTMAKDLKLSKSTVSQNIKNLVEDNLIKIENQYNKNKFKKTNKYTLLFLNSVFKDCTSDSTQCSTTDSTDNVPPIVHNEYCNINNDNNNIVNNKYIPLSKLLYTEHLKNDPKYLHGKNKDIIFNKWADDIRKLVEIDGREYLEVEQVIIWCKNDDFWKCNILSGKKLREKFPQLYVQSSKVNKKPVENDNFDKRAEEDLKKVNETFNIKRGA